MIRGLMVVGDEDGLIESSLLKANQEAVSWNSYVKKYQRLFKQ